MHETLILLATILAIPIALLAVRALMGWRYTRMLQRATRAESNRGPELGSESTETVRESTGPPLAIADLSATPSDASPAATALVAEALARTRRLRRAFALSVGIYAAIVSATVFASFIAIVPTDGRVVAIYLLLGPLLIVLTSALSLPFRWIGFIAVAYVGLLLLSPLVAAPGRILALIQIHSALFFLIPTPVALLAARSLRPVIAFGAAIALYLMVAFGIAGLMGALGWGPSFDGARPLVWVFGLVTLLASVFVVAWMLSRPSRWRPILMLSAMTTAGAALSWFWPAAELVGAMMVGIGTNAIQLLLVWLLFRMALRLQRVRWLSWQALQVHLALALLSGYLIALLLLGEDLFKRQIWSGLAVATAYVCYVVIAHVLLTRALLHQRDWSARRLLFLRTFGSSFRSRRLLRALDDNWRRIGCVDLIGGVDIGIDSVDARMLHAFLIRQPDRLVVSSRDGETAAFNALRTELEGDGRYPLNDLVCAADCWQPVVTRLAVGADVVLMDMRGFTRQHRGCIFELNTLMSHVPLTRLVIVIDESTSRPALDDVARAAWQQLRAVSMNAAAQEPALGLLDFSGRHAERRLFEFLAASASSISTKVAVER